METPRRPAAIRLHQTWTTGRGDKTGPFYRSAYYVEDEDQREQLDGQASLRLPKKRNVPTGDIPLRFEAELMHFPRLEAGGK